MYSLSYQLKKNATADEVPQPSSSACRLGQGFRTGSTSYNTTNYHTTFSSTLDFLQDFRRDRNTVAYIARCNFGYKKRHGYDNLIYHGHNPPSYRLRGWRMQVESYRTHLGMHRGASIQYNISVPMGRVARSARAQGRRMKDEVTKGARIRIELFILSARTPDRSASAWSTFKAPNA